MRALGARLCADDLDDLLWLHMMGMRFSLVSCIQIRWMW